jgi:deoxyadenosine/deoxycytidine kinase
MSHLSNLFPKDCIISIAGTVGVGKSTLSNVLAKALDYNLSLEKVANNPYLEDFYGDLNKWAFHLQMFFLTDRYKEQMKMAQIGGGYIQDRTIYEDTQIFARMLYEQGNMSERDYDTYTSLFNAMVMNEQFPHPNVIIYLEANFERVISQVHNRGRKMEIDTPLQYWRDLYNRYEKWIDSISVCPVIRINVEEMDIDDPDSIAGVLEKVSEILVTREELDFEKLPI